MSYGVIAVLLLRLDARQGQMVPVDELAQHFNLGVDDVRSHCEQLVADGLVQVEREYRSGEITRAMVMADER